MKILKTLLGQFMMPSKVKVNRSSIGKINQCTSKYARYKRNEDKYEKDKNSHIGPWKCR